MGNTKLIEINGRTYDALSGRLVKDPPTSVPVAVTKPKPKSVVSIDGFLTVKNRPRATKAAAPKTAAVRPATSAPRPAQSTHNKMQHSKTLMRRAVVKPAGKQLHAINHAASPKTALSHNPATILTTPKDQARAERAQTTRQHHKVKKFSHAAVSYMPVKTSNEDVHPLTKPIHATPTLPISPPQSAPIMPSLVTSASHGVLDRMLDQALHEADSHKQKPHKNHRKRGVPKWASIGTSLAVVVLLAGFFAYQNMPNVAMRLAAARTGIDASVPGYSPAGFAFNGPIGVNDGIITLRFNANADTTRNFAITQRGSDWDSKSLLENFVIANGHAYQTFQDKGNTIYVYDDDRATWVSKGIWYTIEGNADLNSDQLLKIASSM